MAFLVDGFQSLVTFALLPGATLHEREVKPISLSGGGPIEISTMRNTFYRMRHHKNLTTVGEMSMLCMYDPFGVYLSIWGSLLQRNGSIVNTFPDGSTVTFQGWLEEIVPNTLKEGDFPLADVKIFPSMHDASGAETLVIVTAATKNPFL